MTCRAVCVTAFAIIAASAASSRAQDWLQDDQIFNPSGIPSLPFSQPRLADLDGDGDYDLILGSTECALLYFENAGTPANPAFVPGPDLFAAVDPLDAELGVCVDLDGDEDLDLVTGGFHGLVCFENEGGPTAPIFVESVNLFAGLATGANPVPCFADLDNDHDPDLLVGRSESGVLKYYPNTGTPAAAEFLESHAAEWFDVGLYAYPWFADLDNDLDIDLCAGRDAHGFLYYRNDGDVFAWDWEADPAMLEGLGEATYWNSPCLIDLNGNGLRDLIFGTSAGPLQYCENHGPPADPVWVGNTTLFGGVLDVGGASSPFLFDFDADGDRDLVSGSQLGDIKYYENVGTSEAPAWHADHAYFASIDHSIYSAITLGKLDGDERPDAVVGDLSGGLFYHRNTGSGFAYDGSVFAGIDVGGWSVPRLVDMDADEDLDLAVGNEAGQLAYFENVGSGTMAWVPVPGYFGGIDVGTDCSPTLGDFDRDGDVDLLAGNISRELRYFENLGGGWREDPRVVAGLVVGQNAAPAFGDLDGDHDLDLAVGNYSGTFNYFENNRATGGILAEERLVTGATVLHAQPNPSHPSVMLSFDLPAPAPVDLAIFDAAGRRVAQLIRGIRPAGTCAVEWRGETGPGSDSGRGSGTTRQCSGVYFCRLQVGAWARTITLTRMR